MIIKLEQYPSHKEIEVTIKYPQKNSTVERIVSMLRTIDKKIECYSEELIKMLNISDIYYIESVYKKTFIYSEKERYQTKFRLYQLYDELKAYGFIQISKYCIINVNKLDSIKPLFNRRMEAILINKIHLNVNRNYFTEFKRRLQEDIYDDRRN